MRTVGPYTEQRETLVHELLHAIMFETGLYRKYSKLEEGWILDWEQAISRLLESKALRGLYHEY